MAGSEQMCMHCEAESFLVYLHNVIKKRTHPKSEAAGTSGVGGFDGRRLLLNMALNSERVSHMGSVLN